ncbi:hypothetical protein C0993_006024 [Termitomyces sp. T159_Od127]|nr:hypothetical protein C0993_006024 [Termitomyces sp. T159_Od127]
MPEPIEERSDPQLLLKPSDGRTFTQTTNRQHAKRCNKHVEQFAKEGHVPNKWTIEHYCYDALPIYTTLDTTALPVAQGAYQAKNARSVCGDKKVWTLEELAAQELSLVCWDGEKSHPLVDKDSRVIAVLVGQPQDNAYRASARVAYKVVMQRGSAESFQQDEMHHRRSSFPILNTGVIHSKGTIQPVTLDNGEHAALAHCLLPDKDIQQLATFVSGTHSSWQYKYNNFKYTLCI